MPLSFDEQLAAAKKRLMKGIAEGTVHIHYVKFGGGPSPYAFNLVIPTGRGKLLCGTNRCIPLDGK